MEQITIITRDYHGLTADITSALGSNDINIESLDAKKIDDIGLVMLRVNQYDRALSILRDAGWNAITEDALLVRVKDEPGAIADLAKRFRERQSAREQHADRPASRRLGRDRRQRRTARGSAKALVKDELLEGSTGD